MGNGDIRHAIDFHEETKHSELKMRMSRHYLDWGNRPRPFKVYPDLPSIPLPDHFPSPEAGALRCIDVEPAVPAAAADLPLLSQLLFYSAGITRVLKVQSGTYYMRAASATGALYPIEVYVVCGEIGNLPAGIYHFCPGDFSLAPLRAGDFRASLAAVAGGDPGIASAPATLAFTSIAWRNAWKYRARSYRHWFWDSGVMIANLLAVGTSAGLRPRLVAGFEDRAVNDLLLLEERKEAAIALLPIDSSVSAPRPNLDPNPVPAAARPISLALSASETEYPEIWKLHEESSLHNFAEVKKWQNSRVSHGKGQLEQRVDKEVSSLDLGETILRRGSSRSFARSPIPMDKLMNALHSSTRGVPADFLGRNETLTDIYFVANAVEGLAPGKYYYERHTSSLKQLESMTEHASRNESGYLCLGQPLFGDASAVLFLMADLDAALQAFGNRGYRACQLEAGVIAGKVYLSSYAQGLGASGSTFYDDAVTESFSPRATGKSCMIAVGVGVTAYKPRPGKVLAARLSRPELTSLG